MGYIGIYRGNMGIYRGYIGICIYVHIYICIEGLYGL